MHRCVFHFCIRALHKKMLLLMLLLTAHCACAETVQQEAVYALQISEVQSNNDVDWALGFEDYVEIYNAGEQPVTLSNYYLTSKEKDPFAYQLPEIELAAGAYIVLAGETDIPDFSISKNSGKLFLFHQDGTQCDAVKLPAMKNNVWQREHGLTTMPSPGYENTQEGAAAYRASLASAQKLIINEVVSTNSKYQPLDKEYYDLIEIYNASSRAVQLNQYYLSDSKGSLTKWRLPDIQLGAGKYYVIYASGNTIQPTKAEAPFKVSSSGETLYLSDESGECVDAVYVPALTPNVSFGRYNQAWRYYETPSIGKPNGKGTGGITLTPEASMASCLLDQKTEITLSGEGTIYYTLNGQLPTKERGKRYDGTPLQITKNTVLRVRALADDKLWSTTRTYTYLFDAEKYELPLLCISAEPNQIMGSNGIYTRYSSKALEAAINLTLIEDGNEEFSVDCGLKIHGQGSRDLYKKSFQVRFRAKYGCGELEYKLFEDSDLTTFNSLVLRSGSEDSYHAFFRDEFQTSLTAETMPEVLYQRHRPVNLFIDGEYFGVYYIRERVSDDYAADYLGGENEEIYMVKGWDVEEHGGIMDFYNLLKFCRNNNLAIQENFDYVASQVCLESFMDYYIARSYTGDRDYTNIRHVRSKGGDNKWRLINFDLDWGFRSDPAGFSDMIGRVRNSSSLNTVLINALLQNAQFRDQMLKRLNWHLRNTYAPERVFAHIDSMVAAVEHDLVYNFEIWPRTYEHWQESVQFLRDFVQTENSDRRTVLIEDARKAFKMTEEEMVYYFGDLYTAAK